jgi:hypothetical protein
MLDEIEAEVTGFFTTRHHLKTESGQFGEFTFPAFSQYGVYRTTDGRELLMQKAHWLGSAHELVDGRIVRGRADRPGLLRRDIAIQFDGKEYSLEPEGLLSWGWFLFDAEGNRLLEIQPRGVLKQSAYLAITGAIDPDLIAFAYYLVHMRRQEDAAATAAATS